MPGHLRSDCQTTAARVSQTTTAQTTTAQTTTAVRWAASGLGARPVSASVSQPVIAVLRPSPGPAETTLLELLRQESWSGAVRAAQT
ncbi:MAG: hypothetical protein ACRDPS_00225 [Nocardioides sp.]|uniref:hypothetical protein n=1 Tax=Nocardioides sp. TaxID=35761 RepID=UPI003D6BC87E